MEASADLRSGVMLVIITWSTGTSQVYANAVASPSCFEESKAAIDSWSTITASTTTTATHAPTALDPEGENLPSGQGSWDEAPPGQ